VGEVVPGEEFTLRTLDASGNQIRPGVNLADLDTDRLFPVTGPVAVRGVRTGDAIGLSVLNLATDDAAHCWTRPGLGLLDEYGFHVRQIDLTAGHWPGLDSVGLDLRPHVGAIGVLPAVDTPARDLGAHGGNLDVRGLGPGATLWLTAQVDGGGIFAGDVHAGIGDGEICGTGLETPGEVRLVAQVSRDWAPEIPVVHADGRLWVIGIGNSMEAALQQACRFVVARLAEALGLPRREAHLMLAQVLRVHVCQVVNPHYSVQVSLSEGLDSFLAPGLGGEVEPVTSQRAEVRT
jgi:amidase